MAQLVGEAVTVLDEGAMEQPGSCCKGSCLPLVSQPLACGVSLAPGLCMQGSCSHTNIVGCSALSSCAKAVAESFPMVYLWGTGQGRSTEFLG